MPYWNCYSQITDILIFTIKIRTNGDGKKVQVIRQYGSNSTSTEAKQSTYQQVIFIPGNETKNLKSLILYIFSRNSIHLKINLMTQHLLKVEKLHPWMLVGLTVKVGFQSLKVLFLSNRKCYAEPSSCT